METIDLLKEEIDKLRVRTHTLASEITTLKLDIHNHVCLKEQDWGKLFEMVKPLIAHVVEGDSVGGFRDRVLNAELQIKSLKDKFWQSTAIGTCIGILVGSGSREAIGLLTNWIIGK